MKHLPLSYVLRGLWVRRVSTALTMLSMASVVFVFAVIVRLKSPGRMPGEAGASAGFH